MGELTTVTFDLWQTLLLDTPERGRTRSEMRLTGTDAALRRVGEFYGMDRIRQAYQDCILYCRQVREQHLDLSFQEQVSRFIHGIDEGLPDRLDEDIIREIEHVYSDAFLDLPPQPHPAARGVLASLKDRGFRMGLISNTAMTPGVTFREFLRQHGMIEFFDVLTFSDELQQCKPGAIPFTSTLDLLEAAPGESAHIGDQFVHDIFGAKKVGMRAVWIEGFSERPDEVPPECDPDAAVSSLSEVPAVILNLARSGKAAT